MDQIRDKIFEAYNPKFADQNVFKGTESFNDCIFEGRKFEFLNEE
jgi:hypothetical protein